MVDLGNKACTKTVKTRSVVVSEIRAFTSSFVVVWFGHDTSTRLWQVDSIDRCKMVSLGFFWFFFCFFFLHVSYRLEDVDYNHLQVIPKPTPLVVLGKA